MSNESLSFQMDSRPVRAARVNARVKIGRVFKKKAAKQKYYWVTARYQGWNDGDVPSLTTRASWLSVDARGKLTSAPFISAIRDIHPVHQHSVVKGMFALELTAADYERIATYDSVIVTGENPNDPDIDLWTL